MFGLLTSIETGGFCLLPWCCIWFPNAMGYPSRLSIGRGARETPPRMVWFIGWALLLSPSIMILVLWLEGAFSGLRTE